MGYHRKLITKGVFGEFSKIEEEFAELQDAREQGVKIMELVELADLLGAIEGYLQQKYHLSLSDLEQMKDLTKKAFQDGTRQARH